jgi:hypothetical protein
MPRLALPSLILLILSGCSTPAPTGDHDLAELARAEAARARFRELQERQKPIPAPVFVPVRLTRGPHTEDGVSRTGSEAVILVPRTQ